MGFMDQFKPRPIVRAKVIGVRTAEDTKGLTTFNYGVYSFLVQRDDGSVDIVESQKGDKNWNVMLSVLLFE